MIKFEQVPDEVVHKLHDKLWGSSQFSVEEGRAAIAAALNAWPGMHTHEWQRPWLGGMSGTDLILPLTENPDD